MERQNITFADDVCDELLFVLFDEAYDRTEESFYTNILKVTEQTAFEVFLTGVIDKSTADEMYKPTKPEHFCRSALLKCWTVEPS